MKNTVNEALEAHNEGLRDKIASNDQLANLYMGLLGRMIVESTNRGKPIEGIKIGRPNFSGMTMRARVEFGEPNKIWTPTSDTTAFINQRFNDMMGFDHAKARGLSRAMERNNEFVKFFNSLVGALEQLSAHKSIPFDKLSVSSAILDADDCLVVNLGDSRSALQ